MKKKIKSLLPKTISLAVVTLVFTAFACESAKSQGFGSIQYIQTHKSASGRSAASTTSNARLPFNLKEHGQYSSKLLQGDFVSWGLNSAHKGSINLAGAWKQFKKKKDIIVAVVDTGIDFNHPFLRPNLYVPNGKIGPKNFGMDFSVHDQKTNYLSKSGPSDSHGHGTHVAGIIKSIFPDVKILALKYYNPAASGPANLKSTIEALEYAVDANVDIINYSGGGPEPSSEELRVLKKAERKGILVIAAAGNESSNIDYKRNAYYPASYGLTNIISVMAHNQFLDRISSSNYGQKTVDISAPGYRIKSSIPSLYGSDKPRAGYMTGTSQATAFVTGVVALIKSQYPNLSSAKIKAIVIDSANKNHINFTSQNSSGGLLDASKALALAAGKVNKPVSNRNVVDYSKTSTEYSQRKVANLKGKK